MDQQQLDLHSSITERAVAIAVASTGCQAFKDNRQANILMTESAVPYKTYTRKLGPITDGSLLMVYSKNAAGLSGSAFLVRPAGP